VNTTLDFLPAIPPSAAIALAAALALGWLALRAVAGRPTEIARRRGLAVLRVAALGLVALLLLNPVHVDQAPGPVRRPDLFCLVDSSQSMEIGSQATRWEQAWDALEQAARELPVEADASLRVYQFGHRLTAVETAAGEAESNAPVTQVAARPAAPAGRIAALAQGARVQAPLDVDTRLAEALRQLTGRFGRDPPAGVVVLSDGRTRDPAAVLELARRYGEQGVPIHVLPAGDTTSGGDVALISVVVPERLRKYSLIDVQAFLRSFGYDGQRLEVRVQALDAAGGPPTELASVPLTLRSGIQPVALSFRTDVETRRLRIEAGPLSDELSTRNNAVSADVEIDHTKLRVLYLEGSEEPVRVTYDGSAYVWNGAHTGVQSALAQDEDIECVPLVRWPGVAQLVRATSDANVSVQRGFPDTLAELAAFDAVILSDVAPESLSAEQIAWLVEWIGQRGGGLCMVGGPRSFAAGGWQDTSLAELLPVTLATEQWSPQASAALEAVPEALAHPVWTIVPDRQRNAQIVAAAPPIAGQHLGWKAKPLADVLAEVDAGKSRWPALVAGSYGRGRTLALAAPVTPPWADAFVHRWGDGGNQYAAKFWRNVVYWLTENSAIGRRRLVAGVDKRFYRPGDTVSVRAVAYDETAARTAQYRVWGMVEPLVFDAADESLYSSLRWPSGLPRESGDESPYVAWGEEFELLHNPQSDEYELPLAIAERLRAGTDNQGLRIELTAYEGGDDDGSFRGTQVDSTSLDVQVLDDPFEQQNPFPDRDLLVRVAQLSGGTVLERPGDLAELVRRLPAEAGPPRISTAPLWSRAWVLGLLLGLLTIEWVWRRAVGLA
jgi:uncharacterized membrane protein